MEILPFGARQQRLLSVPSVPCVLLPLEMLMMTEELMSDVTREKENFKIPLLLIVSFTREELFLALRITKIA